jgi:RNA polymerase sigma-70 factor (ECF subfamily)
MTAIAADIDVTGLALERARDGDHDAFAQLVAGHQSMVFSIGYHFFSDRDRAAEIAQDVFLQLFRSLDAIQDGSHLTHWLRQVTSRRCIDEFRRSRFRLVSIDAAHELAAVDRPVDPFLIRRMNRHIAALPEAQRMLVILRYQEDLGPNDISAIVGMPVNTVKSQLHRALRALRRKLEGR